MEATAEIERRSNVSVEEFTEEYLLNPRPVVITDALKEWSAVGTWTPEFLSKTYGDKQLDHRGIKGTLAAVIDEFMAPPGDRPKRYLRNLDIKQGFPELLPDIQPALPYAEPNWFRSRLLPGRIRQTEPVRELFLGGPGTQFDSLHFDEYSIHHFVSQVYGEKEFWFYPPEDSEYLYPTAENVYISSVPDPKSPDLEKYPLFKKAHPVRVTLKPGETVFVAPGWWHITWMPTFSISIGAHCVNHSNWSKYRQEICTVFGRGRKPHWRLFKAYLGIVGAVLERTQR